MKRAYLGLVVMVAIIAPVAAQSSPAAAQTGGAPQHDLGDPPRGDDDRSLEGAVPQLLPQGVRPWRDGPLPDGHRLRVRDGG